MARIVRAPALAKLFERRPHARGERTGGAVRQDVPNPDRVRKAVGRPPLGDIRRRNGCASRGGRTPQTARGGRRREQMLALVPQRDLLVLVDNETAGGPS